MIQPSLPRTVPRPSLTAAVKLSPPPTTTTAMSYKYGLTGGAARRRGGGARFERRPTVQERRRDVTSNLFEDLLPESSINHAPNDRARPRPRLPASQCAALCVCALHRWNRRRSTPPPPPPSPSLHAARRRRPDDTQRVSDSTRRFGDGRILQYARVWCSIAEKV